MARSHRRRPRLSRSISAALEPLENRLLFVSYNFNWVGGSGDWSDPAHWSSNVPANVTHPLPGGEDVVTVGASAGTVTAGNPQMGVATIGANLRLFPAASMFVTSRLTLNGSLTFVGGGQFVTRCVFSSPNSILDGTGNIGFESGGGQLSAQGNGLSLTIGAGITIDTGGTTAIFSGTNTTSRATLNVNGGTMQFDGVKFTNRGHITLNTGFLRMNATSWTNLGNMTLNGGTFSPTGTYRQSDFGTYTRNGGVVSLNGTLLGDLTLDAHTGSWQAGNVAMTNGRYTATGGASLVAGGTFDNYTIGSDLTYNGGGGSIRNNFTLDGATLRVINSTLNFRTLLSTVGGTGRIELTGGTFSMFGGTNSVLTFNSGITMRTVGGNAVIGGNTATQRLVMKAPLAVTASGQSLSISVPNVDLQSELRIASGANLFVQGAGAFNILPGGSLVAGGRTRIDSPRTLNYVTANGGKSLLPGTTNIGGSATQIPVEAAGADRGPFNDGFRDNFALGLLKISTSSTPIKLVNANANQPVGVAEVLYVDSLVAPSVNNQIDLNGLKLYARAFEGAGPVINGSITLIPDGGPIAFALPTSGRVAAAGQQDNWTFFGRAGQTVSVVMNPSTNASASAPAPVNPTLGLGKLTLLSPSNATLGSVQNATIGSISTLSNIVLPDTGTYTLRMQSSAADPNRTGFYKLSLYDVSVERRALLLNTQTAGAIETPFSVDQWTCSLSAGQQVQFDLVSAETAGLRFTLAGPDGYVAFTNITDDSGLITIPPGRSGNYVLTVNGASDESGAYSFALRDSSVTNLPLGTTVAASFAGRGSAAWYRTTLSTPGQLVISLDDVNNSDRNQLYVRRGSPPTRTEFDYRYGAYTADPQVYIPNATPGEWYVLAYADNLAAPSNYSIRADYSDLRITSITPVKYGVNNTMTMTLNGGGYETGTVVTLVHGGTTITANGVEIDSFQQLTANFNLAGVAQQTWDVRVERGSLNFTLPNSFTTLANAPANFEMKLNMPSFPTRRSTRAGSIEYANTGNVAMPAPLIIVESGDPQGDEFPVLSLDLSRTIEEFWGADLPPQLSHRLMVLGSGAVPGMLNPGERMSIPYNYLGEKGAVQDQDGFLDLQVKCAEPGDSASQEPMDWDGLKDQLKPPSVPAPIWDQVYSDLTNSRTTVDDYADLLRDVAAYLGRLGDRVVDVDDLWNFAIQEAIGAISAFPTLSQSVDAQVQAPGSPIQMTRTFEDGVLARNIAGPFGYGWAVPWLVKLSHDADSDVITITSSGGGERIFVRDARSSTSGSPTAKYLSGAGDSSSLRRVAANVYELRESDGALSRFRSDGKLDYVHDANGNRTTAGYDGSGRLASLTHTSGGTITISYDGAGRISQVTDSAGRSTTYTYDAANEHLLSATADDGTSVTYTYEPAASSIMRRHALLTETSGGVTRQYTYDSRGRIASTSLGGTQVTNVSYNHGQVTLSDAVGASKQYFDHLLRLAKASDRLDRNIIWRYDNQSRLTSVDYPDGTRQAYSWCNCGALEAVTDAQGRTTRYNHDPVTHKLLSITDPAGHVTKLSYDAAGNQLALGPENAAGATAGDYTASGLPQSFTNARGLTATFIYNARGQVTKRTGSDGVVTDFVYDTRGRMTSITTPAGATTMTYNTVADGDRIKRVTYPGGKFVEYDYDGLGRLLDTKDQSGYTTRYEYDTAGRLLRVLDTASSVLVTYTYDATGRRTRVDNANGTFTTYDYNNANDLLAVKNWRSAGILNSKFEYTYDSRSRITGVTTSDGAWSYTYNAAGELTAASFASTNASIPNQNLQASYDSLGNRTFATFNGVLHDYASNGQNQYTSVDGVAYAYDLSGNLLTDGARQYTYDDRDRLIEVHAGADVYQFEYNAYGARSAAIVNGTRTDYLRAPGTFGDILAEYDGAGNLLARNVYGEGLIARSIGAAGPLNFFDFDHEGSTAGISDSSGAYVNRYAYDPFGKSLFASESISNSFEYIGQAGVRSSEVGGLIQMGLRDYSISDGRFTTGDPLSFAGDVNTYRYANNSPTMNVDTSGLLGTRYHLNKHRPVSPKPFVPIPDESSKLYDFAKGVAKDEFKDRLSGEKSGWPTLDDVADHVIDYFNPIDIPSAGDFVDKALPGAGAAVDLLLDPEVNQHHVAGMCGLALQREFGSINIGAAKQLAALEGGVSADTSVNAACLDGFPMAADADMGVGDPCGSGRVSLAPRPLDPNDKLPPAGFGPENFIAAGTTFEYTVDFENLGPGSVDENGNPYPIIAAGAAQRITVEDQLSTDLDWTSVRFNEFKFGDTIVPVVDGFGSFSTFVEVEQDGQEYQVLIDASVDTSTGMLFVLFQAIDSTTGLPPSPTLGVLPPEDGSGNGMGYFKFAIDHVAGLPDGRQIRNVAVIQFDSNDVIPTNQVNPLDPTQGLDPNREALITIDASAPSVIGNPLFVWDAPRPRIDVSFSENVQPSLSAESVEVKNLTTGATIVPTSITYDVKTQTAGVVLPASLPNGNYQVTLNAGHITDGAGNHLVDNVIGTFFHLIGDADHNHVINFDDYSRIDNGFNNHLIGYSNGDFNYDGVINFDDYALIDFAFNGQGK